MGNYFCGSRMGQEWKSTRVTLYCRIILNSTSQLSICDLPQFMIVKLLILLHTPLLYMNLKCWKCLFSSLFRLVVLGWLKSFIVIFLKIENHSRGKIDIIKAYLHTLLNSGLMKAELFKSYNSVTLLKTTVNLIKCTVCVLCMQWQLQKIMHLLYLVLPLYFFSTDYPF